MSENTIFRGLLFSAKMAVLRFFAIKLTSNFTSDGKDVEKHRLFKPVLRLPQWKCFLN